MPAILLVFLLQVPEVFSFVSSAFILFTTNRLLLSLRTAATFQSPKHAKLGLVSGTCNGASFLESSSPRQIFVRLPPSHRFSSMQKRRLTPQSSPSTHCFAHGTCLYLMLASVFISTLTFVFVCLPAYRYSICLPH